MLSNQTFIMFDAKTGHVISFDDMESLLKILHDGKNQHRLLEFYPTVKFYYTEKIVIDIFDLSYQ